MLIYSSVGNSAVLLDVLFKSLYLELGITELPYQYYQLLEYKQFKQQRLKRKNGVGKMAQ